MIVCIQSPSRLLMMQDQKSLTHRSLSCSGWGKERVSLVFSYEGGRFIRKGQRCAKVNILRLTVGYLNASLNRNTRNTEPEIGTNRCSHTRQNPQVDGYRSGFGQPKPCRLGFCTVLEPNWTIFPVWTRTAGRLPGPVATSIRWRLNGAVEAYRFNWLGFQHKWQIRLDGWLKNGHARIRLWLRWTMPNLTTSKSRRLLRHLP
jgi:hypothetical protein